jgi:regulatory protein
MPFRTRKAADESSLYEYALSALGRKMRSVAELKRLLRARVVADESGEAMVESVVARLKEHGYLNDTAYAAAYSTYRKENEKFGRRRVITDLKARGVHREVIDKAVADAYSGTNEEQLARAFLRRKNLKKPANGKQAARIFRALMRAGFSGGTAMRILKKWDVDEELLTALEAEGE